MQSQERKNLIIGRLFPGEDVGDELKNICQRYRVKTAVIVSGLGQLGRFSLGFFKEKGNYLPQRFSEPHELLSLNGIISKDDNGYEFHLHATLGNAQKAVVGGHFIEGRVSVTAEIVLLKTGIRAKRIMEETGLKGLCLEKERV